MRNINLKNKDRDNKRNRGSFGTNLSIALLVIIFCGYGIIFGLNLLAKNKSNQIKKELEDIKSSFAGEEKQEVYNFGVSLIDLNKKLSVSSFLPITEDILIISEKTLPETQFSSIDIEMEGGISTYSVESVFPGYEILAKQIRAYKEEKHIKNILLSKASKNDEKGNIEASFSFVIDKSGAQSFVEQEDQPENF